MCGSSRCRELETLLATLSGRPVTGPAYPLWVYPANFLLVFLVAGGLEEFGWRAFAQPRLQSNYSAVLVALGIGVAWAVWHLPLFLLFEMSAYDASNLPADTLGQLADSVVMAWLFNETDGSVLPPWMFHSAGNLPAVMTFSGTLPGVVGMIGDYGFLVSVSAIGAFIVVVYGRELAAGRLSSFPVRPGRHRCDVGHPVCAGSGLSTCELDYLSLPASVGIRSPLRISTEPDSRSEQEAAVSAVSSGKIEPQ